MEKKSNFEAGRPTAAGQKPSGRRPVRHAGPERALKYPLEIRLSAVERAKKLIADANYPSPLMQRVLARELAVQLTTEMDPLP